VKVFISGTDTGVGKTLISSWLAIHTGFSYFKPIQTGTNYGNDSEEIRRLSDAQTYPECYSYCESLSPHLAARIENDRIDMEKICLPREDNLIIEGAGGLLVPMNDKHFMVDLIKKFEAPAVLVSRTELGTINHTLLSLEALRSRDIEVLGVIMNGESNAENKRAIEFYGNTSVIAEFPRLYKIDQHALKTIELPETLVRILRSRNRDSF